MQLKKITSIFEYAGWLLKKYNEQQNNVYRIAKVKSPLTIECKIVIQIIGKSTLIECSPQEIAADDRLLEGFSKKDIRTITYLACQQIKKPRYRIVVQEFCNELNKMLFKLTIQNSDKTIVKTANQISIDKDLINGLSQEDMQSISYIAGYEHSQNEKNEMELAKKNIH